MATAPERAALDLLNHGGNPCPAEVNPWSACA
jgi:hypothetical protein